MTQRPIFGGGGHTLSTEHLPLELQGADRVREKMAARLNGDSGRWHIKRDNADRLQLWRELGDGYYASHTLMPSQVLITPGPVTLGGVRRATCLSDMGVGVLMQYEDLSKAVFAPVSSAWLGLAATYAGTFPDITEGVDPVTITVSTTAGSSTVTVTSAALTGPTYRYTGRRLIIPGAGTGGTDHVATIGNVMGSGTTLAINGGSTPVAVTDVEVTLWPKRHYVAHDAATPRTATYTAPVGATSVGIVHSVAANGGLWTVAVDGDLTLADALPTAQEMVDRGFAPASTLTGDGALDPTTRVLSMYGPVEVFTLQQAIATGLDPAVAHTVVLTSTAHIPTGSNNTRGHIAGFGYGTRSTTPATPGAQVFYTTRVSSVFPTHELAINHQPTGASEAQFAGGTNHGYEYAPTPVITVDGAVTTIPVGKTVAVGQYATVTVTSEVFHPEVTGDPTFGVVRTYGLGRDGLVIRQIIDVKIATSLASAYVAMLSVEGTLDYAELDAVPGVLDTEDYTAHPLDTYMGVGENTAAVFWDSDGEVAAAILVPTAAQITAGYSDPIIMASIRQRFGGAKFYANRTTGGVPLPISDVIESEATVIVGRFPDGAARHLPVG